MEKPVYVIVQGRLNEGAEEIYGQYVKGVLPLMKEFGVESVAVGAGFESEFVHRSFPINIVMKLADEETLGKLLGDPRYLEIKEKYRDPAYAELTISVFHGREPQKAE